MGFILTGFNEDLGFRVFKFDYLAANKISIRFEVRANIALARRYGIRLQELPLMCRRILEGRSDSDENRTLIFTEEQMVVHAKDCLNAREEAALKKKPLRRPAREKSESASPFSQTRPPTWAPR